MGQTEGRILRHGELKPTLKLPKHDPVGSLRAPSPFSHEMTASNNLPGWFIDEVCVGK